MVKRGKHDKTGTGSAEYSQHVPRHGGPQTGNGLTAQGRKPMAHEVNIPGVSGTSARLGRMLLQKLRRQ